jgi:NOL1/NOP2/sun family putative RNA methylase
MLPNLLTSRLQSILWKEYNHVLEAFSTTRKGSFRLNLLKTDGTDVFAEFGEKGIITEPFDNLAGVFTFDRVHEYAIKGTRSFYDGKIYLQSIASILPVLALEPKKGEKILDVCAAPGSKTTQLAMIMQNEGKITALEQNQIRYDKLMHNCRLQGATIVDGRKMDAKKYLAADIPCFDRILLDAPCSAEGRISLDNEKSHGFWSIENIRNKSEIQYELVSLAISKLEKWGTLVYSTCTLAPEENEGMIARVLSENKDLKIQDIMLGLSGNAWWKTGLTEFEWQEFWEDMKKAVRILPSDETEGFFMVKVKKV